MRTEAARRPGKKSRATVRPRWQYYTLLVAIAVLLGIVIAFIPDLTVRRTASEPLVPIPEESVPVSEPVPQPVTQPVTQPKPEPVPEKPIETRPDEPIPVPPVRITTAPGPSMYIVIDDVGNNMTDLNRYLDFPEPITFAVMPGRPYSRAAAKLIMEAGHQVILHQPMEPEGGEDPGPRSIYTAMDLREIRTILEENFADVPGAVGMNNHMGSKATADADTMRAVLSYLAEYDLFFLDSVTTPDSVAESLARELSVPFARRNSYFLDNMDSSAEITETMKRGVEVAEKNGYAVLIGHVWSDTLRGVLDAFRPELSVKGYRFGVISDLVYGEEGQ